MTDQLHNLERSVLIRATRRAGEVRYCQGTAVVDWVVVGPDGASSAAGTNVFELAPDGRIAGVVGFWSRP